MDNSTNINVTELLEAGVHFGHRTSRWNPKMAPYIFGVRDDIHVMDLRQTVPMLKRALDVIYKTVKSNGKILFVSTKVQASELIAECAERCGQYYVNSRWFGGMLTNWPTISQSIKKMSALEKIIEQGEQGYTKKELLELTRKKDKLMRSLGGIRAIGGKPDLLVVIDTNREHLAIAEATKLGIPIIGIVDSNSNPDHITYPIPGNDDSNRAIKLYCELFADTALRGVREALTASGVDLGADINVHINDKKVGNVTKFKPTNKVSRFNDELKDNDEFENKLSQEKKEVK